MRMDKIPFEWDSEKNRQNKQKHGIGFSIAQYAFADLLAEREKAL